MGYFQDNRKVNFIELEESGIYSKELIEEIRKKHYEYINIGLNEAERRNKNLMEPLLYAVKEEYGTYKVYEFYGDNLQENIDLAIEIIEEEPEVFNEARISNNKDFILDVAEVNPKVVIYMSENLKEDSEFTKELCELQNSEITKYVANECKMPDTIINNPEFASNKDFMIGAIMSDANLMMYLDESLKNDQEFIKEVCNENEEAIEYISDHTDEFGKEALIGAQNVLRDKLNDNAKEECKDEIESLKIEIEKEKIQGKQPESKLVARKDRLEKRPELIDARLKGLEDGDSKAIRYAQRVLKICKNLKEEDRKMIEQSLTIGQAIAEKQKEKYNSQNIEKKVENEASLKGIEEEITVIREEKNREEKDKKQIEEKVEENTNDESINERA